MRITVKVGLALLSTILVGAIGSGLWELGMKPSLQYFGQKFLDTITLGSTTMKDNAYLAAALDQTAIPAVRVYEIVSAFAMVPLLILIVFESFKNQRLRRYFLRTETARDKHKDSTATESSSQQPEDTSDRMLIKDKTLIIVERTVICWIVLSVVFVSVQSLIHNQSLLIWRSFHADLRQCAPYMTSSDEELIEAQYAAMKSKSDYAIILGRLRDIAKQHNIKLHSEKLW